MDLSTTYMGLKLKSPLVPSASPLSEKMSSLKALEDAGASAVVFHSLFEEQIRHEQEELVHHLESGTDIYAESLTFFPEQTEYRLGPEEYLKHIRRAKESLSIPVIASLNGMTPGGWVAYAKKMEEAGADAIECNIYFLPTSLDEDGASVEKRYLEIIKSVKSQVSIPVAVKLSPHFSSIAAVSKALDEAGADGLALFNRFYQPDFDLETLEISPNLILSNSFESRMVMRWVGILHGRIKAGLAATSGIHSHEDALKVIMAGADVAHVCSALLLHGPKKLTEIESNMRRWMEDHEYESVSQMKGSMSHSKSPDPGAWERANYMKTLNSYK